jgi:hypothetical protein
MFVKDCFLKTSRLFLVCLGMCSPKVHVLKVWSSACVATGRWGNLEEVGQSGRKSARWGGHHGGEGHHVGRPWADIMGEHHGGGHVPKGICGIPPAYLSLICCNHEASSFVHHVLSS